MTIFNAEQLHEAISRMGAKNIVGMMGYEEMAMALEVLHQNRLAQQAELDVAQAPRWIETQINSQLLAIVDNVNIEKEKLK
jgi:hypothetical protein